MKSYALSSIPDGVQISKDQINYAEIEYEKFIVREVLIGEKPKFEYHIKIKDGSDIRQAVAYFQRKLEGCDIGLVDPLGILALEFPIYIIVNSELLKEVIIDKFDDIDSEISPKKG